MKDSADIVKSYDRTQPRIHTSVFIGSSFMSVGTKAVGLWDTGASQSAISLDLVRLLGLRMYKKDQEIKTIGGNVNTLNADAYISIGGCTPFILSFTVSGALGQDDTPDLLIGMDVINRGDLSITNAGGHTEMKFRIPARGHIGS